MLDQQLHLSTRAEGKEGQRGAGGSARFWGMSTPHASRAALKESQQKGRRPWSSGAAAHLLQTFRLGSADLKPQVGLGRTLPGPHRREGVVLETGIVFLARSCQAGGWGVGGEEASRPASFSSQLSFFCGSFTFVGANGTSRNGSSAQAVDE